MGTITDLHAYLAIVYPSLNLRAGLVFQWSGVRFDLWPTCEGDGRTPKMLNSAFRSQVLARACTVFRAVNNPEDALFFVIDTWRRIGEPVRPRTGLWVMGHYTKYPRLLVGVGGEELPYLYADDADEAASVRSCRFCIPCRVSDIRVRPLLTAIANRDFPPLKPRVIDDCYFVNTTKNTIFHMFDDRGADVISADPAVWQRIAAEFEGWVVNDLTQWG